MSLMRCMHRILRLLQNHSIKFPFFRNITVGTCRDDGPTTKAKLAYDLTSTFNSSTWISNNQI